MEYFFFGHPIHPLNRRRQRRRPSQPFHDHRSPTKKPMKIGKKIKTEKIFGYLVGRSVGRSAANLVLSSSSYCFCWLVGRRWKEKKDEKRLKEKIEKYVVGHSVGGRRSLVKEGGKPRDKKR